MKFSYHTTFGNNDTADENDIYKKGYYPPKYYSIKEVHLDMFNSSFESFLYFLCLFPNLEVLKIEEFCLVRGEIDVNYRLSTPLIVITTFDPKNIGPLYEQFIDILNLT
ncbi:hypothetical protein K502DRAFT_349115 [Neoconidiobolus thromboides FSU 785]|nr:hypothetical protein K502DRAFT_349115 [Neoconidiobolus thromboides FSU 785]